MIWTGCAGVTGTGTPPASGLLSMGASSLGFGTISSGSSKTLTINATNSGTASVTVSAASISTSAFTLMSSLPVTIAAGQSTTFSVQFTPPGSGTYNATLALTSNASDALVNIPLSGSGGSTSSSPGQLTLNPTSQGFGSVTVGQQQSQTVTLTNSGGSNVDISQASISGTGFQLSGITAPLTLTPSQSTTFSVAFAPNATGAAAGTVTIVSDGSNPTLTMSLSGTGLAAGDLSPNPSSLGFNTVTVGNNKSLSETVTNTGGTSVVISSVAISGTGFTLSGITAPVTLAAGQGATFSVKFTPGSAGSASGSVTLTSNATNTTLAIPLSGTGANPVGTLSAAATLPVGSVVVGTSGEAQGSLTASGASVTVSAASTNNSEFVVSGVSLPATIPAGQSVNYTVTFTPSGTGSASATLTFTSNASPSTTTQTLTGTGTAAPTHSVSLQWNASTSENVSGYNVYRAVFASGSCGSYGKINPQLNTGLLYTDSNVVDGTSYCYAATAVNTSQEESSYSNIASNVQIPAP
jgi:hypothetical protein